MLSISPVRCLLLIMLLVLIPMTVRIPTASAHVVKSDGTINVFLHVDPDDSPIVGKPSRLIFEISDSEKKFSASHCDCMVYVKNGSVMVSSGKLTNNSFSVLFPETGVYTITLDGNPKDSFFFQKFSLSYDQRVDRLEGQNYKIFLTEHVFHILFFSIAIGLNFAFLVYEKIKRKS